MALQKTLLHYGYSNACISDTLIVDSIWNAVKAERLINLATNTHADVLARLIASEILYLKDNSWPQIKNKAFIVILYAKVLDEHDWAYHNCHDPGEEESMPVQSKHLISFGQDAIPYLTSYLCNNKPLTCGVALRPKNWNLSVKHLAAFFIGKIKKINLKWISGNGYGGDLIQNDSIVEVFKKEYHCTEPPCCKMVPYKKYKGLERKKSDDL